MPSTSPGGLDTLTQFTSIFPGAPTESLQATTTFVYRFKRYIAYVSGQQLNILSGPRTLVQAITFQHGLVAVSADPQNGKVIVAGHRHVWVLEPTTEGWTKIWWETALRLRREDDGDVTQWLSWGKDGEVLVAGSHSLSLFSTLPRSRSDSPRTPTLEGDAIEDRRVLWSKSVASPIRQAVFSPSANIIASSSHYDRLVKIWRRLSFEDGLFDYIYLPHPGAVTHIQWRPLDENAESRRGSGISGRHDEDPEVLYTIANDGILRIWRTGGIHDLEILSLHTSIDLVAAIPDSPSISVNGRSTTTKPARYSVLLPSDQFTAALNTAIGLQPIEKVNHSKELLKEMASRELDVVVALDGQGRMSAWGLQSIGHKRRPETPTSLQPVHLAHAERIGFKLPANCPAFGTAWFQDDKFNLLVHALKEASEICWWEGTVESFFSSSVPGPDRLSRLSSWRSAAPIEAKFAKNRVGIDDKTLSRLETADGEKIGHAVPVPMPHNPDQTCVVSISNSGRVTCSLSHANELCDASLTAIAEFETGVAEPALFDASSEFAVVLSPNPVELIVLDLTDGYVEFRKPVNSKVNSLVCFTPNPRNNFLAIVYESSVDIMMQGRYVDRGHPNQIWHTIKQISIVGLGLQIGSVAWQPDGSFRIAAGCTIFVTDSIVELKELDDHLRDVIPIFDEQLKSTSLLELPQCLANALPAWHPSTLSTLIYHGQSSLATVLLSKLANKLKFYSNGDYLSPMLDEDILQLIQDSSERTTWLDEDTISDIREQLDDKDLPVISEGDQRRLRLVVETIIYLRQHIKTLDTNALRYLFEWKLQLQQNQENTLPPNATSQSPAATFVPEMRWQETLFAYHSNSQQALLDILILHHDNKMTWHDARRLGITCWLKDRQALELVFDQLAQTAYRASQPPDPVNAAIYFLALHKIPTLLALWRIATWHKEQRTTVNFLKRDFTQLDARTAAKKNAYALMGKRRFHYSAAFFLLADDPASACNVLAGQCEDFSFAVAVARLYCGDGSQVLWTLLNDRLVPQAKKDGNRWLLSWCHSVMLETSHAAEILIEPLGGVKTWEQDDPATLLLYQQLRRTTSEHEYDTLLRAARILRKMGLWLLALDLVRAWRFKPVVSQPAATATNGVANGFHTALPDRSAVPPPAEPPSLLDSFAVTPSPIDEKAAREAKAAELLAKLKAKKNAGVQKPVQDEKKQQPPKPKPTDFKEPDANSLLDAFGF